MASKDQPNVQNLEQNLTAAAKVLQGAARPIINVLTFILPYLIKFCGIAYNVWVKLPKNVASFITGTIFCFFGGVYPVTFAAVQAAEHAGRQKVIDAVQTLAQEALIIIDASKKDDEKDDDGDGIKDVNELSSSQYLMRKFTLVMTKIDPQKLDEAISSLYRVWLAVLGVISVEFVRTITLALSISDFLKQPLDRFVAPTIELAVPKPYKKWVPVVIGWITKSIAMSIAWYIQSVISAFTSALTGGLMMARALYAMVVVRGFKLWGLVPDNHEDSYLDEILSYVFAAMGFYVQIMNNFDVPFPLDLVLWPLDIVEFYLRWTITKEQ